MEVVGLQWPQAVLDSQSVPEGVKDELPPGGVWVVSYCQECVGDSSKPVKSHITTKQQHTNTHKLV